MTADENTSRQLLTGGETSGRRFLSIEQAAQELNVSEHQIRALLKCGELRGIQIGGRGLWRIGVLDVEHFIEEAYARTAARIASGEIDFADMKQEEARTNGRD